MSARIADKHTMYELLHSGALGNTARTWFSVEEMGSYDGLVGVRSKKLGGTFRAHVPATDVPSLLQLYPEGCVLSEMQRDEGIVIQGYVCECPEYYLQYSREKTHMRVALERSLREAVGSAALRVMQDAMDPQSYEDCRRLLETYPGAVVEFSCYAFDVGVVPGRNTLFWEVRHY